MNEKRRPKAPLRTPAKKSIHSIPRGGVRQPLPNALATVYGVVGTRGRRRLVLLVCCPFCASWHVHSAVADFTTGKRTAACHQGRYLVHVGALEDGTE